MMFGNKIKKINRNKQIFKRKNVHQKYTMPKEGHFCDWVKALLRLRKSARKN